MDSLRQDMRHALRVWNRARGFSVIATLTLALGIGVTTTVFALVDAALRGPAGVPAPARLMTIEEVRRGPPRAVFSYREYRAHRERATAYVSLAAHQLDELSYRGDAGAEVVLSVTASDNYFETLRLRPAAGRLFGVADANEPVVVLGHDFWRTRLASDPHVIGRTLILNGQPLTVIGVAPAGFRGVFVGVSPAVWVPVSMYARLHPGTPVMDGDRYGFLQLIGRLAEAVSREQAESATSAAARAIPASDGSPREEVLGARVRRLTGLPPRNAAAVAGFLALLLGTAALVLVIASINVAGMLLARARTRGTEIAVRVALGAGRARLIRQLLMETLVLFGAGAACGVLLAVWLAELLNRFRPPLPIPLVLNLGVDARVLAFSLVAALGAGMVFGLAPAAHAVAIDPMRAIRAGAGNIARRRARGMLVSAQFSAVLVLLVAAALFTRAVAAAASADPGFDAARVGVAHVDLDPHGYDALGRGAWFDALMQRLRALPEIEAAGLAGIVPLGFSRSSTVVEVPGADRAPAGGPANVEYNVIDAGYLDALKLRIVAGRVFDETDDAGSVRVALVNETFARTFWGADPASAVGRTLREDGATLQVVGVVEDSRYRTLTEPGRPHLYLPFAQRGGPAMAVFARGRGDAAGALAAMRREIAALDPDVPLIDAQPLEDVVALSVYPQRLAATLIGIFGVLGLALAAVGIYGVIAYDVARSTREIGIRMALGAERSRIRRSIALRALRLAGIGTIVGCAIALPGARVLASLLHGVSPSDPLAFAGVVALLATTVLFAAYLPARRAAAIEPSEALRQE